MSAAKETTVKVNGRPCRVWEKGSGEPLGFLAGFGGLPNWSPILDVLAETRRVIAPSMPGNPGSEGHTLLDTQLDWVLATQELLEASGLAGADLVGVSVGGALAAEVAAVWREMVKRLVLVAPFGLFDESDPVMDLFALAPNTLAATVCSDPRKYEALCALPEGEDEGEWQITLVRAREAAARLLWPLGDTKLVKRLPRIGQPTLLVWGEQDKVIPRSYAERFSEAIAGKTEVRIIPGAGHLADVDAPDQVGQAVLQFLNN